MANRLEIKTSTYSNYENNHREPSAEIIKKISENLDVSIPFLLYGVENDAEYSNFQAFIDYCYTIGFSVETPVSDPEMNGIYYVRLKNGDYFTLSPEAMIRLMNSCEDYISYLFHKFSSLSDENTIRYENDEITQSDD